MVNERRKKEPYAKLKKWVDPKIKKRPTRKDTEASFESLASLLKNTGEHIRIQVKIIGKGKLTRRLDLTRDGCTVKNRPADRPEIEFTTTEETYWEVAKGKLSPVDAFFAGKVEVKGKCDLLSRIYKKAASRGRTDL
jgi:putative sterol carrier protein